MRVSTAFLLGALAGLLGVLYVRSNEPEVVESIPLSDADGDGYLLGIQTEDGLVEVESKLPFLGAVWEGFADGNDD